MLARGGSGTVHEALHLELHSMVAVKVIGQRMGHARRRGFELGGAYTVVARLGGRRVEIEPFVRSRLDDGARVTLVAGDVRDFIMSDEGDDVAYLAPNASGAMPLSVVPFAGGPPQRLDPADSHDLLAFEDDVLLYFHGPRDENAELAARAPDGRGAAVALGARSTFVDHTRGLLLARGADGALRIVPLPPRGAVELVSGVMVRAQAVDAGRVLVSDNHRQLRLVQVDQGVVRTITTLEDDLAAGSFAAGDHWYVAAVGDGDHGALVRRPL